MGNKEYRIKVKKIETWPFDERITKLEMRAFGWRDKGLDVYSTNEYDVTVDVDNKTVTARRRIETYLVFKRIEPYSRNVVFMFWELLMSIQSWIRRKLIYLLFGITALLLIIGIGEFITNGRMGEGLFAAFGCLAVVYLPSLFYALMGWATRKIYKIDKKLEDSLENNGYDREQYF